MGHEEGSKSKKRRKALANGLSEVVQPSAQHNGLSADAAKRLKKSARRFKLHQLSASPICHDFGTATTREQHSTEKEASEPKKKAKTKRLSELTSTAELGGASADKVDAGSLGTSSKAAKPEQRKKKKKRHLSADAEQIEGVSAAAALSPGADGEQQAGQNADAALVQPKKKRKKAQKAAQQQVGDQLAAEAAITPEGAAALHVPALIPTQVKAAKNRAIAASHDAPAPQSVPEPSRDSLQTPEQVQKKKKKKRKVESAAGGTELAASDEQVTHNALEASAFTAAANAAAPKSPEPGNPKTVDNHKKLVAQTAPPGRAGSGGGQGRAFQRVNAEDWIGQKGSWDNSYAATFGVSGWGARAQERLGQVRGKDFRHEKTKKKRGTYRGGAIDGEVRSFKYDSD